MTKKFFYGFLIASSLIFNAVFIAMWLAHAVPRHFYKHCKYEAEENIQAKCPLQKALSMSDGEWSKIHPRIESLRETTSGLYREMSENRAKLVDELEKNPIDSAALSACRERIAACQKNIQAQVVSHILEEKKLLTQEQQKRFFSALRSNMSCGGLPGMMGAMPEGISGRCQEKHIERRKGETE
jgi:Spy/CpxP family protein refolding chaperone